MGWMGCEKINIYYNLFVYLNGHHVVGESTRRHGSVVHVLRIRWAHVVIPVYRNGTRIVVTVIQQRTANGRANSDYCRLVVVVVVVVRSFAVLYYLWKNVITRDGRYQ